MGKTAIYPRVSSDMQVENTSLDGQIELCYEKARELGIPDSEIIVYREDGFTGEDIDRPAMNNLRKDVENGIISRFICTHPDRLSRDLLDKLIVCREFDAREVEIVFVDTEYKDTPEGQLFFNMQSSFAQYELAMIKKRTVRGRLNKVAKEGKIMPMRVAPYGYDYRDQQLHINETEAFFVRLIYHWYVYDKLTLREIGEQLFKMGASPKRGESGNWNATSISRIIVSEIYIGLYVYNKRKTKKLKGQKTASGKPKKTYTIRDEKDWIYVSVPAIIPDELFELAQEQRGINTKKSGNQKMNYLLKSMIRCSHCGRLWESTFYAGRLADGTSKRYPLYRCPNKNPRRYGDGVTKCEGTVKAEFLESYVWECVMDFVNNGSARINDDDLKLTSNDETPDTESVIEALEKQIEIKKREREKIKTQHRKELITDEEFEEDMTKLNQEMKTIQSQIDSYQEMLESKRKSTLSDELTMETINEVKNRMGSNGEDIPFEIKKNILELLVREIVIDFKNKNEITVGFVGLLGNHMNEHLFSSTS